MMEKPSLARCCDERVFFGFQMQWIQAFQTHCI